MKRLNTVERFRHRRAMRLDARGIRLDKDDGRWITTENGHHVHLNEEGKPDKGNRSVINAMKAGRFWYGTKKKVNIIPKLPKLKNGAKYSETMNVCGQGAVDDKMSKKLKKVLDSTTPSDIVYQKNSKGETIASIPGLASKIDNKVKFGKNPAKSKEVQAIYDNIRNSEQKITSDVIDMSNDLGCNMSGLEFSMKAGSHFAEKIDRVREKRKKTNPDYNASDEEIAKGIGDCVRYTMMTDHNKMVENANKAIETFKKKGYKIDKVDNRFYPKEEGKDVDYKGIHLDVISPDGQKFEFQIHSDDTMGVKNVNHKIYEKTEGKDGVKRSEAEKKVLFNKMVENASKIPDPPGIYDFYPPEFAKKKK